MTNFIESDLIPFALKIIKNKPQGIETKDLLLELRELMKKIVLLLEIVHK